MVGRSPIHRGRHCHPPACTRLGHQYARGSWFRCCKKTAYFLCTKYAQLLDSVDLNFIPFPITTFGELSSQADSFVDAAVEFYSARQQLPQGLCRSQLMQQLSFALMQHIGKRLLAGVTAAGCEESSDSLVDHGDTLNIFCSVSNPLVLWY